ncbi:hypothetical protein [Streptomyces sp. NPDC058847]|uniref:hypothetical protein n=1 Tax=Streptomyces sp. NPDC058847 TaxID=3346649 RepID=UPI0036CF978D
MRDFPEAGQDADATEVLPADRPFQVTDETPTTGTASAGSGAGWFGGSADDAARRGAGTAGAETRRPGTGPTWADAPRTAGTRPLAPHGSTDADPTEILGARIGQDPGTDRIGRGRTDRDGAARGRDPLVRGRITWGANQTGSAPDPAKPDRANPPRTNPDEADPTVAHPGGAGAVRTAPGGATAAVKRPDGVNRAGADSDGADPVGGAHPGRAYPVGADLDSANPNRWVPGGGAPERAEPTRGAVNPDDARTDVLPPVAPASPTRAFPAAALRDPWQDSPDVDAGADHTHDPHEVTVQLDAVQLGDGVLRRADGPQRGKSGAEGSDGPVFVDASGRRSRLYRRLGIAVGVACAVYAVVIVSTLLSGNSNAPWLPVDGQQEGKPAGQVDTTPLPSQSARPSATAGTGPQTSPSAGTGLTTAPGADAPAPGMSGSARQPGTSADPDPSQTSTGTEPGGDGGATRPDPSQSSQEPPPASTGPSTPAGGGEPTGDPTDPTTDPTTGTDPGGDGDTTANGASDPLSAAGPAGPDITRTSSSLSPENTL